MRNCSVIILSYNTKKITDTAIQKAKKAAIYSEKRLRNKNEIIVVDNGSTDGSVEMLAQKHPEVISIQLPKNVGVARGYNEGMKKAKGDYILLINNDTYLFKDTIYNAILYMEKNRNADVMYCRVVNRDKEFVPIGGHLPTPFKTIRWLLGGESIPLLRNYMKRLYTYNDYQKDFQIEWIPTCFFFMRKAVYQKTKGHDKNMFLYMEDVEFCKKINDEGFQIWFTPTFSAMHLGGQSSVEQMQSLFLLQKQIEGLLYYQKKHFLNTFRLVKTFVFLGLKLRSVLFYLLGNIHKAKIYNDIVLS
ncbi:MAG TPA: glycosyltransferase family 2 protein [Candidatus Saccharimonadales bacterium]|nr:glycosyltransferase family 2 protein [Candidatus Saccharimonadales bacterium]